MVSSCVEFCCVVTAFMARRECDTFDYVKALRKMIPKQCIDIYFLNTHKIGKHIIRETCTYVHVNSKCPLLRVDIYSNVLVNFVHE